MANVSRSSSWLPGEQVFFQDRDVMVTNARFNAFGVTHALSGIVSVHKDEEQRPTAWGGAAMLLFMAALVALGGAFAALKQHPTVVPQGYPNTVGQPAPKPVDPQFIMALFAGGGLAVLLGIVCTVLAIKGRPPWHRVNLTTAAGNVCALKSFDERYAYAVLDALNTAIIARAA